MVDRQFLVIRPKTLSIYYPFAVFADARTQWLGDLRPAWTAFGVAVLATSGALVEIKISAWSPT
jgi:enamine deaminase RidA (YjgF/YER057c/UK114 family)